jgi:hypothetical protein
LPVVLLALGGCSSSTISLIAPPASTPVVTATLAPTEQPQIVSTGFDKYAGNCLDAANADMDLISYAQSQNYSFDMQLQVAPTADCGADAGTAAYRTFVTQVGQVTLNMNEIDSQWVWGYAPTREAFIDSVFAKIQARYPSASKVTINVTYAGQVRAILTYNGRGQPTYQDFGA